MEVPPLIQMCICFTALVQKERKEVTSGETAGMHEKEIHTLSAAEGF